MSSPIFLVASGDLRLSANQVCWAAQDATEKAFIDAVKKLGRDLKRAHPFQPEKKHGFIDSQRYGIDVFRQIPLRPRLSSSKPSGNTPITCWPDFSIIEVRF